MIKLFILKKSFFYAAEGWKFALHKDQNLRIHFIVATIALFAAFVLQLSLLEIGIIVAMITLVISAELMNTAVEKIVDLITAEHHPDAKFAKDVSSAMVLTTAIGSAIVGSIIFLPHIL